MRVQRGLFCWDATVCDAMKYMRHTLCAYDVKTEKVRVEGACNNKTQRAGVGSETLSGSGGAAGCRACGW